MKPKIDDILATIADDGAAAVGDWLRENGIVVRDPFHAKLCDWLANNLKVLGE